MYHQHYGLDAAPFSIAPDPRFLYLSERHREALAHLLHGVGSGGGFILLTGEVGTGKTTLCRSLLQQLPDNVRLAYVLNPRLSPLELLQTICEELRIAQPDNLNSLRQLTDAITERLIENHRRGLNTVLMIDEAQQLSTESLEQIRLLTNLETSEKKLLQIILIGQPELQQRLAENELRQLAQRITARYHLLPLSLNETASYVVHRLQIAAQSPATQDRENMPVNRLQRLPFSTAALRALHRYSGGIPRLINTISERALIGGYAKNRELISEAMMRQAAFETLGPVEFARHAPGYKRLPRDARLALLVAAIIGSTWLLWRWLPHADTQTSLSTTASAKSDKETAQVAASSKSQTGASPATEHANSPPDLSAQIGSDSATLPEDRRDKLVRAMLASSAPDRQGEQSAHALFALWNIDYMPRRDGAMCSMASVKHLRCASGFGDWAQLAAQNYPAIVSLQSAQSGPFSALLYGLREGKAILRMGRHEIEISRVDFESLWNGSYTLIWQAPFDGDKVLAQGSSGNNVIWLANALAVARGETAGAAGARFDASLAEQLKTFQRQYALVPDAVAGEQTLMALASRQHSNQPRLDGLGMDAQGVDGVGQP